MSAFYAYTNFHFTLKVTNLKLWLVKTFDFPDDRRLFFDCFLLSKNFMVCLTTFLFLDFRVRKSLSSGLKTLSIYYLGVTRLAIKSEFSQFW